MHFELIVQQLDECLSLPSLSHAVLLSGTRVYPGCSQEKDLRNACWNRRTKFNSSQRSGWKLLSHRHRVPRDPQKGTCHAQSRSTDEIVFFLFVWQGCWLMSCLSDVEEGYYGGHSAQNSIPATAIVLRATIRLRDYSANIFQLSQAIRLITSLCWLWDIFTSMSWFFLSTACTSWL